MTLPNPLPRNLFLNDQVDQETIGKITEEIIKINEDDDLIAKQFYVYDLIYNPKPIKLYIDSFGGSVYQILGLIGIIEKSLTPIWTYATGAAMSAGFELLVSGHRRFAYPYSTMMYHQLSAWAGGMLEEMKDDLKEYKRLQKVLDDNLVKRTKLTKQKLKEVNKLKKDWFITPQEALQLGIIDEII